jgi:hypothetical protein
LDHSPKRVIYHQIKFIVFLLKIIDNKMQCFSKPLQIFFKILTFIKPKLELNIKTKCLLVEMKKIFCYKKIQAYKIHKLIIILIGHINHLHRLVSIKFKEINKFQLKFRVELLLLDQ